MTTLLTRCQSVTAKSQQLALAQRNVSQERQVQERTREWRSRFEKLNAISSRAAYVMLDDEASANVVEKRSHLRHNATQVLERLEAQDDIAQLTSDSSWERLLASIDGLSEVLELSSKAAWRTHIDSQGVLEEPGWLRNRAPLTPSNDAAIADYRVHYAVYAGLVKLSMPRSADDLAQLSEVIAACRTATTKIKFDVPPNVQQFFQAIQAGSASLASLTPGVLTWLTDNGLLEHYRIRSASQ